MSIRPLLATASVVLNLMSGRQTQDRRPIKPQPSGGANCVAIKPGVYRFGGANGWISKAPNQPGDILWVREAFAFEGRNVWYRADCDNGPAGDVCEWPDGSTFCGTWRPSIHMPKWAARTFLSVEWVLVERIKDISEEDARAEGVRAIDGGFIYGDDERTEAGSARGCFFHVWQSIYAKRGMGWDANPLVFSYGLKLTDKPKGWGE